MGRFVSTWFDNSRATVMRMRDTLQAINVARVIDFVQAKDILQAKDIVQVR